MTGRLPARPPIVLVVAAVVAGAVAPDPSVLCPLYSSSFFAGVADVVAPVLRFLLQPLSVRRLLIFVTALGCPGAIACGLWPSPPVGQRLVRGGVSRKMLPGRLA